MYPPYFVYSFLSPNLHLPPGGGARGRADPDGDGRPAAPAHRRGLFVYRYCLREYICASERCLGAWGPGGEGLWGLVLGGQGGQGGRGAKERQDRGLYSSLYLQQS